MTALTPQQMRDLAKRWLLSVAISVIGALAAVGAFCILSLAFHGEVVWR